MRGPNPSRPLRHAFHSVPRLSLPSPGERARALGSSILLAILIAGVLASSPDPPAQAPSRHPLLSRLPVWGLDIAPPPAAEGTMRRLCEIRVTVTGYSSTPGQTDSTPFTTASMTRVRRGVLALSRDLLREFTPGAPFGYGDVVEIKGVGRFHVEDTMNSRYRKRADIWFESSSAARAWGKQSRILVKLLASEAAESRVEFAEFRRRSYGSSSPSMPLEGSGEFRYPLFQAALTD